MVSVGVTRTPDDRMIAGVIGGMAKRFGISSSVLRTLYVVGSALSAAFPGILVYIVLWLVIPQERRFQD